MEFTSEEIETFMEETKRNQLELNGQCELLKIELRSLAQSIDAQEKRWDARFEQIFQLIQSRQGSTSIAPSQRTTTSQSVGDTDLANRSFSQSHGENQGTGYASFLSIQLTCTPKQSQGPSSNHSMKIQDSWSLESNYGSTWDDEQEYVDSSDAPSTDEWKYSHKHGYTGEVWVRIEVMGIVATFPKESCSSISQGGIDNLSDDGIYKSRSVEQGFSNSSTQKVFDEMSTREVLDFLPTHARFRRVTYSSRIKVKMKVLSQGERDGQPGGLDEVTDMYQIMLVDGTIVAKILEDGVTKVEPRDHVILDYQAECRVYKFYKPGKTQLGGKGISPNTGVPLHLKGSCSHHMIKGFMIQGGDVSTCKGTGGKPIDGLKFEDENFELKQVRKGMLSIANSGPNINGSQFFITTTRTSLLDGKQVFGKVTKGMGFVRFVKHVPIKGVCSTLVVITEKSSYLKKTKSQIFTNSSACKLKLGDLKGALSDLLSLEIPWCEQCLPNGSVIPGNNNSVDKCQHRCDIGDSEYLRYHGLQEFDLAMHHLEEKYGFMTSQQHHISRKDEGDRVIVFEHGDWVFVFNFHWMSSYSDYLVGCLKIEVKPGIAFVEFGDDAQSSIVIQSLYGYFPQLNLVNTQLPLVYKQDRIQAEPIVSLSRCMITCNTQIVTQVLLQWSIAIAAETPWKDWTHIDLLSSL